jgi:hypothetical protein
MSRTIALQLTDEEFATIQQAAESVGRTPEEVIVTSLRREGLLGEPPSTAARSGIIDAAAAEAFMLAGARKLAPGTGKTPEEIVAEWNERMRPILFREVTEAERQQTIEDLRPFIGIASSGDPDSANNERIDADLAREYGSTHEEEA